jgi:NADH dehydrogenase
MSELTPRSRPRVVIIGGGFGGLNAAREFKREDVDVVLIDRQNYHLFQPLLYQVATAGLSPADIAANLRNTLSKQKNAQVVLGEVKRIDRHNRIIGFEQGEMEYDYLVIAAGMKHNYFGNEEKWAKYATGLKNLEEALDIRRRMLLAFEAAEYETDPEERERLLTFVVVGGGPTGLEMAGSIAEVAREVMTHDFRHIDSNWARIVLVEGQDRLISSFDKSSSKAAYQALEARGVEIKLETFVEDITDLGVMAGGTFIPAHNVIWAAGLKAESLVDTLGVEQDRMGRVFVEQDLRAQGDDRVFVIGDIAHFEDKGYGGVLPGQAPAAIQQGKHVGKNIILALKGAPLKDFEYFDKGQMATIGRASAVAEAGKLKMKGLIAWLAWLFVHIMYLVGFRDKISVLINWVYAYVGFRRATRFVVGFDDRGMKQKMLTEGPGHLITHTSRKLMEAEPTRDAS